jgi:hypothetical protein
LTCGPGVDVGRRRGLLERGKARGHLPSSTAAEDFVGAIRSGAFCGAAGTAQDRGAEKPKQMDTEV